MTVGYGHLIAPGDGVGGPYDVISPLKATELLINDVQKAVQLVNDVVTVDLTQDQFDALVIFSYNIGGGAFENSTLLKDLNSGQLEDAAGQFVRWDKVNGVPSPGLLKRRLSEQRLFLGT